MAHDMTASLAHEAFPQREAASSTSRTEVKSLTSLRGIAAIIVVLCHFSSQFTIVSDIGAYTSMIDYGWIMVDFFFLLSGFVLMIAYSKRFEDGVSAGDYRNFMQNRLARIYPLHLFMLLCFIALELGKYVYMPANLDPPFSKNYPTSILTNLLLVQAWGFDSDQTWNWASWSISAEFAAYILFPFIVVVSRSGMKYVNAAAALTSVATLVAIKHTIGHGSIDLTYHFGMLRCLPPFVLGVVTFNWLSMWNKNVTMLVGSDLVLYASMASCIVLLHTGSNEILVIIGFAVLVGSASLNTSSFGSKLLSTSPIYFLGVISYSIYMTHSLIIRLWRLAVVKIAHDHLSAALSLASIMLLLAVIIIISWFTFRYVETPGRRLLRAR